MEKCTQYSGIEAGHRIWADLCAIICELRFERSGNVGKIIRDRGATGAKALRQGLAVSEGQEGQRGPSRVHEGKNGGDMVRRWAESRGPGIV